MAERKVALRALLILEENKLPTHNQLHRHTETTTGATQANAVPPAWKVGCSVVARVDRDIVLVIVLLLPLLLPSPPPPLLLLLLLLLGETGVEGTIGRDRGMRRRGSAGVLVHQRIDPWNSWGSTRPECVSTLRERKRASDRMGARENVDRITRSQCPYLQVWTKLGFSSEARCHWSAIVDYSDL